LLLNGTNGYATVTNAGVFNFTNAFTVEAWIKVASFTTDWQAIVTKGDSAWRLHRYDNNDVVSFGTSGLSDGDLEGVTPVDDGDWHHVAGVYDGAGNKYLYVDGALDAYSSVSGTVDQDSYPLDIGENAEQTNRVWDGEIDEVRIWNVALSQGQIQAGMHESLAGSETGLVAYYRLDETAGTSITNSVPGGSAQNGVLTGAVARVSSTAPIGTPVVVATAATEVGTNSATLNGTVLFNFQDTAYYFRYGTTTNYGTATPCSLIFSADADASNAPIAVIQSIEGLSRATAYHFQLVASNSAGTSFTADQVLNTGAHSVSTLYTLGNGSDGAFPNSGLVVSGNSLYGTTSEGGNFSIGTVFKINTDGTGYTNLYNFTGGADGSYPNGGLLLSGNTLYGMTGSGGMFNYGTVFKVNTDGTGFANLFMFARTNGSYPDNGLVLSGNTLYGMTDEGGGTNDAGEVFKLNIDGTGFTILRVFTNGSDGAYPVGSLVLSGNTLYGAADGGGEFGSGTVFAVSTNGLGFTNLYSFTAAPSYPYINSDGAYPEAGLLLVGDTLYGTALNGGSFGSGTIFAVNTNGGGFTNLHTFTDGNDGAFPRDSLILAGNLLYGTADGGGSFDSGTIFAANTNGGGFTNLYTFTGGNDGAFPEANLVLSGNTFYGTAEEGGANGSGTIFSLTLGSAPAPIPLFIQRGNHAVILSWSNPAFSLQSAPAVNGVYTNVPGATSPYTNAATGKAEFFRLKAN
jgi:uncharacterized repeat protein (TIGR03803 family)